jgi:hypothetical protein
MSDDISKYLIGVAAGLIIFLTSVFVFRKELSTFLLRLSKLIITGPAGVKIEMSGDTAAHIATDLLNEIDTLITKHLKPEEVQLFLNLLAMPPLPSVSQVFPNFQRGSREHSMLRALRGVYFIRPKEGSVWEREKHIEITTLGKIVGQHKRDVLQQAIGGGSSQAQIPAQG